MDITQPTLPQELVLLTTAETSGKKLADGKTRNLALAGALLAELAIQGAVTVEDGKVFGTGSVPSAYLTEAQKIADGRPARAKVWVRRFSDAWNAASAELVGLGILGQTQSKFFGLARFPVNDPEPEARSRKAIKAAVDELSAALLAVVVASTAASAGARADSVAHAELVGARNLGSREDPLPQTGERIFAFAQVRNSDPGPQGCSGFGRSPERLERLDPKEFHPTINFGFRSKSCQDP